jgi:cytosine/adenosine deaminase-related metal-dependent hydrolase
MKAASSDGLTFVNASIAGSRVDTLRIQGGRIASLGQPPQDGDLIVDLRRDRLLPGLINAHDHLQLNNSPRLEYRERYRNAREWIADFNSRLHADRALEASVAIARHDRLLVGGVKNLLSGVTTVAHHDPLYPMTLSAADYPTRVVQNYGWSHSLSIDGEESVRRSYRRTPVDWPWIIHAAEGVDDESAEEFERLEALGCLCPNTLIVHGTALDQQQQLRLADVGAGLLWCPSSNLSLFGKTADIVELVSRGRVALGSDSRLTGARDLLEELHVAAEVAGLDEQVLESLVTTHSAQLLRLADRGALRPGARADLLVLPWQTGLSRASRADVRLVMLDGLVRYGDQEYAEIAARAVPCVRVRVDGRQKILDHRLVALLRSGNAREQGLELPDTAWRAA